MNSNLPVKKRDGIFYKIFQKIKQIFRKNKYKAEKIESNEVISNSNNQFKNDIKIDNENIEFNSQMNEKHVKKYCRLGQAEKRIMETAFERLNLTVRGYHKVLKTARTIADIEGEECINAGHLSEAFSYRNPL